MRLIDANYVDASLEFYAAAHSPVEGKKEKIIYNTLQSCRIILGNAPTIDAVPVVRCKDCKHYQTDVLFNSNYCCGRRRKPDDFCSYGERKEDRK